MVNSGVYLPRPGPLSAIRLVPSVSPSRNGSDWIGWAAIVLGLSFDKALWARGFFAILVVVTLFCELRPVP